MATSARPIKPDPIIAIRMFVLRVMMRYAFAQPGPALAQLNIPSMTTAPSASEQSWAGVPGSVTYALLPPHAVGRFSSVTVRDTIGVSFSGHKRAVVRHESQAAREIEIRPGDAFVLYSEAIEWLRVAEPAEALEIHLAPATIARAEEALGASRATSVADALCRRDPVVWSICVSLRAQLLSGLPIDALAMDELLLLLAEHLLLRFADIRSRRRGTGKLGTARLVRVDEFIDANLHRPIALEDLAEAASLSVHHFARAFRNTTGMPPYAYVGARRMQRARELLIGSNASTRTVAAATGYASLPHFRERFMAHFGTLPGRLRAARISVTDR